MSCVVIRETCHPTLEKGYLQLYPRPQESGIDIILARHQIMKKINYTFVSDLWDKNMWLLYIQNCMNGDQ